MRPAFRLDADGAAVAAALADRLLGLTVTDNAGLEADALEIDLDNRDDRIAPPRRGATLALALGHVETGLVDMGAFVVSGLRGEGGGRGRRLTIVARAADLAGPIRDPRTQTYRAASLADVARAVAARHSLSHRIAPAYEAPEQDVEQADESDLNLLTRLAEDAGAAASIKAGTLIVVEAGAGVTADGRPLPELAVAPPMATDWSWSLEDRDAYRSCAAFWRDLSAADRRRVRVGEVDPCFELRRTFASAAEATRAATARLKRFGREGWRLSLALGWTPDAMAEGRLRLGGFDAAADGPWRITRATHRLTGAGLTTEVEAERAPDEES